MKKRTIWTIAIIMGFSFLALLFLQLGYIQEMVDMKKEQFDESVNRALYQASRNLELNETLRYLEKDVNETERRANRKDSVGTRSGQPDGTVQHSHQYSVSWTLPWAPISPRAARAISACPPPSPARTARSIPPSS